MGPRRQRWASAIAVFVFILQLAGTGALGLTAEGEGLVEVEGVEGTAGASSSRAPLVDPAGLFNPHQRPHILDHTRFNYFAVEVASGADPGQVAEHAGLGLLQVVGSLAPLENHWLMRVAKTDTGNASSGVKGATELIGAEDLGKRSRNSEREPATIDIALATEEAHKQRLLRRVQAHPDVLYASLQSPKRRLWKRSVYQKAELETIWKDKLDIHDPGAAKQWHLYNADSIADDLNVTGIWMEGITGADTTVCIIDDGLDYTHPDLKEAFFLEGSWDFNGPNPSSYPTPKLADDRHGTRCAGEVSARRNDKCGVGVAYNSKVAGIRILSADITEVDEAASITYGYQKNQIYSCSWGPADDGRTVDGPPPLVAKAFREGIERGRGGLGSIYVFATGNGGGFMDNCNFDGYTNSLYTITIGAIDKGNNHPQYSETCSAQLAVTYSSSGGFASGAIYTSDVMPAECTDHHGGTSAAAPLAAGVMALVLSVRPDLHWRDLQRLLLETARPDISINDPDWVTIPSGRKYNHKFGYGRIDTYAIVQLAKSFKTLGAHTWFQAPYIHSNTPIPQTNEGISSSIEISEESMKAVSMYRLEHVTVTVALQHARRGDVEIRLISPKGMVSVLATQRPYDTSTDGLRNWTFMSVKHWDEPPAGTWTLKVYDTTNPNESGTLQGWTMRLWGEAPDGVLPNPVPLPPGRSVATSATAGLATTSVVQAPATSVAPVVTTSAAAPLTTSAAAPATTTSAPALVTTTNPPAPTTTSTTTAVAAPPPPPAVVASSSSSAPLATATPEPDAGGSNKSSAGLFALITVAIFVAAAGLVVYYLRKRLMRPESDPATWQFTQLEDLEDDEIDGFLDDLGDEELELGHMEARKPNGSGGKGGTNGSV